jgi:hypothetical protein
LRVSGSFSGNRTIIFTSSPRPSKCCTSKRPVAPLAPTTRIVIFNFPLNLAGKKDQICEGDLIFSRLNSSIDLLEMPLDRPIEIEINDFMQIIYIMLSALKTNGG